jgi:N-acetyl-anhydromuramyl-L-alanine amidase AmpD
MTLRVVNRILECMSGARPPRPISRISTIMVHRISAELGENAVELAKAFRDQSKYAAGSYTGGQIAYTFIVRKDGVCEQAIPLSDVGWHALRWSREAIGIGVIGDFHLSDQPTEAQWETLIKLCSALAYFIGAYTLVGHTEVPGSTKDLNKRCPGQGLSMEDLRAHVAARLKDGFITPEAARGLVLAHYGIVINRDAITV